MGRLILGWVGGLLFYLNVHVCLSCPPTAASEQQGKSFWAASEFILDFSGFAFLSPDWAMKIELCLFPNLDL